MDNPILTHEIDQSHSVLMPHFDVDLNLLWLTGKGDLFLKYYEWNNGNFFNY